VHPQGPPPDAGVDRMPLPAFARVTRQGGRDEARLRPAVGLRRYRQAVGFLSGPGPGVRPVIRIGWVGEADERSLTRPDRIRSKCRKTSEIERVGHPLYPCEKTAEEGIVPGALSRVRCLSQG